MLEQVVRQLSHDLSMAEKAVSRGQAQPDADAALKALPSAEREVKALSTRVSYCTCMVWLACILPALPPLFEYLVSLVQQVCGSISTHARLVDAIQATKIM